LARDILLALAAAALLWLAVRWALRPLDRLRKGVQARAAGDLTPLAPRGLPADVLPLVEALNHHVERHREEAQARRRFVDDASHQLRTPLATLATQVGYALRESDAAAQREALLAIKSRLDETIRGTNQMLLLARADSLAIACAPLDLEALAQALARRSWAEASERGIDLGLEGEAGPLPVLAHAGLLGEAVANLLHNALRYTPHGGRVTLLPAREGALALLSVIDDGPGIPAAELARAGERFFRGSNVHQPGTGLGLAIVRSVAARFGGTLRLAAGPQGHGLCATLVLPLADEGLPAGFGANPESELKVPGR
ncbi:MAG: sensor histidine kinase, partial [Burkholderiales bacterium]|nr:sensor histidine kinase [Burkholderiales bacterium]